MKTSFIHDFSGGQKSDLSPLVLGPNEFSIVKNAAVGTRALTKRPGMSEWFDHDNVAAIISACQFVVGGIVYFESVGSRMYFSDGVTKTDLTLATYYPSGWTGGALFSVIQEEYSIITRPTTSVANNQNRMIVFVDDDTVYLLGITTPVTGSFATAGISGSGGMTSGTHYRYVVTFYNPTLKVESAPTDIVENDIGGFTQMQLTNIPTLTEDGVTRKRIYRTRGDGEIFRYCNEIAMATVTHIDAINDLALGYVFTGWDSSPIESYRYAEVAQNRLFAGNHQGTGSANRPWELVYSHLGSYGAVKSDNFIYMPDRSTIRGLHALGDKLVILSDGAVRMMYIRGHPTEWMMSEKLMDDGPRSDYASCKCENLVAFVGLNGVFLYDGVRFVDITKDSIRSLITGTDVAWMIYTPLRRRLYIATSNDKLYCYDFETSGWVEYDTDVGSVRFQFRGCLDTSGQPLFPNNNDKFYNIDLDGTDDDGTGIETIAKSGITDLGTPGQTKLIREVLIDLEWDKLGAETGNVTVTLYNEKGGSQAVTKTMSGDSGTDRIKISVPPFNAKTLQWQITDNAQFDVFELQGIGFRFIERRVF